MIRRWYLILSFAVLCGCESVVDLDIPEGYQSVLVVQSHFSPDSLWKFRVGKSVPSTDYIEPEQLIVPNARVVILGGDDFRDTLQHVGNGIYQTVHDYRPQRGVIYTANVEAAGFPQVEASSWAPPLQSELLEVKRHGDSNSLGIEDYELRFRLEDQPGNNYYTVGVYQAVPACYRNGWGRIIEDDPSYSISYRVLSFQSTSTVFNNFIETVDDPTIPDLDDSFSTPYFSDQLFDATTEEFQMIFQAQTFESIQPYFRFVLTSLSDDLFVFERSIVLHDYFLGSLNIAQRSPPVVHSNVENGLGIFAGYSTDINYFDEAGNIWQDDVLGIGSAELQPCK